MAVDERRVVALEGEGRALERIRFEDGDVLARGGLFVVTAQRQVPLVEVAARVGFASPSHFHRAFRRLHAVSPGEWRATHRGR
ncbi:MAG: helix-turn-helix domain-containing protein [Myxococcales bacterium]|nr:helix-turn-helix domain-containing protein [Myxococcales bacterium]